MAVAVAISRWATVQIGVLFATAALATSAWATTFRSPPTEFDLSAREQRELEAVACRSFNLKLQVSLGIDWDDDRGSYKALTRCARHGTVFGHPVFFERDCYYEGSWTCENENETLEASYQDRRVRITAEGLSITEAYSIVSYFVSHNLFEPADVLDPFGSAQGRPLDHCHVKALQGNEMELKCQNEERRVERMREKGTIRYRQIPLPWCATTDNDACVYGP